MYSISEYIFEKLKLNSSSRIREQINSNKFADFLLNNYSKYGLFKDLSSVTKNNDFNVGSCYYIMNKNMNTPFFIFMWHIRRYDDSAFLKTYYTNIMLASTDTNDHICIYYIVTANDANSQKGEPVNIIDFYNPDISIKDTKDITKFKLNNLDLFGNLFIEMLNKIHDCRTSPGRLQNFKKYAKMMKKYISL